MLILIRHASLALSHHFLHFARFVGEFFFVHSERPISISAVCFSDFASFLPSIANRSGLVLQSALCYDKRWIISICYWLTSALLVSCMRRTHKRSCLLLPNRSLRPITIWIKKKPRPSSLIYMCMHGQYSCNRQKTPCFSDNIGEHCC